LLITYSLSVVMLPFVAK